uniref:Uncharacterized protein n=1 Tax=Zea mays TaxID=4577 RepID=C4IZV3_MAIZE|nr:unknown [Zea mays]
MMRLAMVRTTPLVLRADLSLRHGFKFLRVENLGNLLVPQRGSPR